MKNTIGVFFTFFLFFGCRLTLSRGYENGVEEMYYWKEVIFEDLPYDDDYLIGKYPYHIPENNDILALAYHPQSSLMIATIGRVRPGVPSALNAFCVSDYEKGTSPHIWGFPNYAQNTLKASFYGEDDTRGLLRKKNKYSAGYYNHFYGNYGVFGTNNYSPYFSPFEEFSIIDTYGPAVDNRCNRLYVLDVGIIHYAPDEMYEAQKPAYIVFDLPSNGCQTRKFPVIKRVEIPQHALRIPLGYLFVTIDHQPKGSCDDVFLYSTNIFDNSILVYDYKRDQFWSFLHPSMNPIISESNFIFDSTIPWFMEIGISSLTLGWPDKYGNRIVYYAPGSSTAEYVTTTKTLKNSKKAPTNYQPDDFSIFSYRGCDSQALKQVFDEATGVLFFGSIQSKRISCWNTELPLNPDTIGVIFESDEVQFVSDMFIDPFGYLWFISNHLPIIFLTQTPLNLTDVNARAFRVRISDAIKGTICDPANVLISYQ